MSTENLYEDFDTASAAADIGAELFDKAVDTSVPGFTDGEPARGDRADEGDLPIDAKAAADPVVVPPVTPDPATPAVVPGQNSEPLDLPKSWKKEMAPVWTGMSPEAKTYVREREAQVMRGINQYQQGYQAWDNLIKPFQPVLEANPEVNPILLMQGLMATHLQLLSPSVSSDEKTSLVKNLLTQYGINLEPGTAPQSDPALIARLAKAEQTLMQFERSQRQAGVDSFKKQVDEFSANPENEHFDAVANDILRFIQTGAATDLKSAYELACWANPAIRAKMVAKQQSLKMPTPERPRKPNGQFLNLEGEGDVKPLVKKVGTIDQTIDAVVAAAYTKH
jgi:hypothetical protein